MLLLEEQQAVCILVTHHSISDGRSVTFVIRDLLQALAGKPMLCRCRYFLQRKICLGITSSNFVLTKAQDQKQPGKPLIHVEKKEDDPKSGA